MDQIQVQNPPKMVQMQSSNPKIGQKIGQIQALLLQMYGQNPQSRPKMGRRWAKSRSRIPELGLDKAHIPQIRPKIGQTHALSSQIHGQNSHNRPKMGQIQVPNP